MTHAQAIRLLKRSKGGDTGATRILRDFLARQPCTNGEAEVQRVVTRALTSASSPCQRCAATDRVDMVRLAYDDPSHDEVAHARCLTPEETRWREEQLAAFPNLR